jgi:ribonuclease HII
MRRLALRYPGYAWERNVGYATPQHRAAIHELGVTPHHRLTFTGLQFEMEL